MTTRPAVARPLWSVCIAMPVLCSGCDDDLRGSSAPSTDGASYFVVADDNGGGCGPILVDGRRWPHAIGERGRIAAGRHRIACGTTSGGDMAVDVPEGVVYTFDYWGP